MRVIALSDTHGDLSHINRIVRKHSADAVIHTGDFGFLSHDRMDSIPKKEQVLNIKHNQYLPNEIRKRAWDMEKEERIEIIQENQLLGEFDRYLSGELKFDVPVYAIPGNHEDSLIVEKMYSKEFEIQNLHMVSEDGNIVLEDSIRLFGIGGNFLLKRFFQSPEKQKFYPSMTFEQWVSLRKNIRDCSEQPWILTHVSPGKEPLLELFGIHLRPKFWFSGHMGAPYPQHYSLFTFADDQDLFDRTADARKYSTLLLYQYIGELTRWFDLLDHIHQYFDDFEMKHHLIDDYSNSIGKSLSNAIISAAGSLVYRFREKPSKEEMYRIAAENTSFPNYETFKGIIEAKEMFELPYKEYKDRNDTMRTYLKRDMSNTVKGTWFFNLPDVYTDAYMVIDTFEKDGKHVIQSFGQI